MKPTTLVLSGGGSKGVVHLGALEFCWQLGDLENIKNYWGVSVGSIISLFLILGYTPREIFEKFFKYGLLNITDLSLDFSGLIKIQSLGNNIVKLIDSEFSRDTTFYQLYKKTNKKFTVIGTLDKPEITERQVIFNYITTPDTKILEAIEISCALPYIFTDKIYDNEKYLDGCFVNELPVDIAFQEDENILAIWLKTEIYEGIYRLLTIPMLQSQLLRNEKVKDIDSVDIIEVEVSGLGILDLMPSRKDTVEMWGVGFRKAEDYYSKKMMDGWEF